MIPMDTKKILNRTAEQMRQLAKATQESSETAFSYGKQKVQDGISNMRELRRMKNEIPDILDHAKAKYQQALTRYEMARDYSLEEASRLDTLEQSIIQHDFVRFGHLYECAVNRTLQLQKETGNRELVFEVPAVHLTDSIPASIKGIAAGGTAAASLVGLTALFGTASTGAAIAGLHGSAAVGATLSALGGGSLAAGGLGIAGGLAVAAGAFVVPALAIGTYFWGKDIEKDYAEALRFQEEADRAVQILDEYRQKFHEAGTFAASVHHSLSIQRLSLGTMLDIFERSLSTGHTKDAYSICGNAVALMGQCMTLSYHMDQPLQNQTTRSELELVMYSFGQLQGQFGAYIASMEEQYRKEAEQFLAEQEESLKKAQSPHLVRPIKNEEIRLLLENTFQTTAQKEICIISPWVTNPDIEALMETALERGVTIKLLYGMYDKGMHAASFNTEKRYLFSQANVDKLKQRFSRFGNRFRVKETNTHAKLLIADEMYYYIGSYNLLSFQGKYEEQDELHSEIGDYSENPLMIRFYKETYFDF